MGNKYQKKLFINDLLKTDMLQKEIREIFFLNKSVANIDSRKSLSLRFADRDGEIAGRMWQDTIKNEYIGLENLYVWVTAHVGTYEGTPTLYVNLLEPVSVKELKLDPAEFAKTLPGIDAIYDEFVQMYREEIKKPHLLKLLDKFFTEPACIKRFKELQGGKAMHHVVRGGYVQHTYSVFEYCLEECSTPQENELRAIKRLIKRGVLPESTDLDQIKNEIAKKEYPVIKEPFHENFDRDILLAAAALHDLGKVKEYKPLPYNQRTDEGILIGHTALTVCMVYNALKEIDGFTKVEETKLIHCLLTAHNGNEDAEQIDKLQKPMCLEAQILSEHDEHDARRDSFNGIIKSDYQQNSNMTKYNSVYNRYFYKL